MDGLSQQASENSLGQPKPEIWEDSFPNLWNTSEASCNLPFHRSRCMVGDGLCSVPHNGGATFVPAARITEGSRVNTDLKMDSEAVLLAQQAKLAAFTDRRRGNTCSACPQPHTCSQGPPGFSPCIFSGRGAKMRIPIGPKNPQPPSVCLCATPGCRAAHCMTG